MTNMRNTPKWHDAVARIDPERLTDQQAQVLMYLAGLVCLAGSLEQSLVRSECGHWLQATDALKERLAGVGLLFKEQ